ncbi:MAG: septal ring lytic transglycosylase RlpA family protein [Chitinophagaceae bacterium]|nr:septal ring lytic transglycosylase RlpA family protein [Chitinophagaceae bacterium]
MRLNLVLTICLHLFFQVASAQQVTKAAGKEKKVHYGIASYYGAKFHGRPMANGERFDERKLTAAHNKLPLGTWVRVRNLHNKKSVIVQITDRMHPKNKRLIDLSKEAARQLGFLKKGLTKVSVEVVEKPVAQALK